MTPAESQKERIPIAGVGASAGGLEALERFFRTMPPDTGVAFAVVQHLSPDFKSMMDELLSRVTTLAVKRAEDGVAVEPNTVYIMPPRKEMIVSGGVLLLTEKDAGSELRLPIDIFLRSLAQDAGNRAIGVVLSGTGTDGSRGLREIHEAGGLVLVQDPETAKFDGMPRSALDSTMVDLVTPPERMGEAIANYIAHLKAGGGSTEVTDGSTRAQLSRILGILRDESGVDFSNYKPTTVLRRIERRLLLRDIPTLDGYIKQLDQVPEERDALFRDLLIGVTKFFRDEEAFRQLGDVIKERVAALPEGDEFRAWVAGCGTGEEAYSIAMLIDQAFHEARRPVNAKVFATDIHRASLEIASTATYNQASIDSLPPAMRRQYFTQSNGSFQVSGPLRQMIVFARHNVVADAPFTRLDLVTCRNLLIYLNTAAQRKVLSLFLFGLRRGGTLFLGKSENAGAFTEELEVVHDRSRIYRKRRDNRPAIDAAGIFSHTHELPSRTQPRARPFTERHSATGLLRIYDALLDEYMPPALLISDQRELLHVFGGASKFLGISDGRPSNDVLNLIKPEIKTAVTGALQLVRRKRERISLTGVRIGDGENLYRIEACPVGPESESRSVLIAFHAMEASSEAAKAAPEFDIGSLARQRVEDLERELQHSQESLQATIEELETSNEELQASNEELVASNEELQSTNEELQSVNEELYTVNAEFQNKIRELTELATDMDHLLESLEVGIVFLDRQLKVRKFTPLAADLFSLEPQDVGRTISDFRHRIDYQDLLDDIEQVVEAGDRLDREVKDPDGNWFLLRLRPYQMGSEIGGAVLTLIDVAALKQAEERVRKAVVRRDEFLAMLSHELRNPLAAIVNAIQVANTDGAATKLNHVIDVIDRQSSQMARLLDDLLDISRVTRDKIQLQRKIIDLRNTCREAVETVRSRAVDGGIELTWELPEEPLLLDADPTRLLQVLTNLLSNAIKYNEPGGHVALRVYRENGDAVIRVWDDGIGMSEELLDTAFDPFVQSDRGLSRSDGGMGVGLTLARRIVDLHEGSIRAHSAGVGHGSEFVVRLGAISDLDDSVLAAEARPALVRRSVPILIVEDNSDSRAMLAELLTSRGYRVTTAVDGETALAAFAEAMPQLALVDIGLPKLDGYELARRLREQFGEVRLVALTGYGQDTDRQRAFAAGFDEHLIKPVELADLDAVLGRLL